MKKNSFRRAVREALSYVILCRTYIFVSVGIFFLGGLAAFLVPDAFSGFDEVIKSLADSIDGMGAFQLILYIFQNNSLSALFAILLGSVFGFIPVINSLVNGAMVGYVLARVSELAGPSVIWRLFPHGIFELPAIFVAFGMGIRLGASIFARNKKKEFIHRLVQSLNVFLLIIVPLLIIAAIIEGILIKFW